MRRGSSGGSRSVLLVLQGMDTSGKGGTVNHVVGQVDPGGVPRRVPPPTPEELRRHFLWRFRKRLPEPGMLAAFDRSHYEDVVAARARARRPPTWSRRCDDQPVRGEARGPGHVHRQVLLAHLPRRAARAASGAARGPYQALEVQPRRPRGPRAVGRVPRAYGDASSAAAPRRRRGTSSRRSQVVPELGDRQLLVERIEELGLGWPPATFDVEEQGAAAVRSWRTRTCATLGRWRATPRAAAPALRRCPRARRARAGGGAVGAARRQQLRPREADRQGLPLLAGRPALPEHEWGSAASEAYLRVVAMGASFREREIGQFCAAL